MEGSDDPHDFEPTASDFYRLAERLADGVTSGLSELAAVLHERSGAVEMASEDRGPPAPALDAQVVEPLPVLDELVLSVLRRRGPMPTVGATRAVRASIHRSDVAAALERLLDRGLIESRGEAWAPRARRPRRRPVRRDSRRSSGSSGDAVAPRAEGARDDGEHSEAAATTTQGRA